MIGLILIIVAPILLYILHRIKNKRKYELAAKVPGLDADLPVIGLTLTVLGLNPTVSTNADDLHFILKNQLEKLSEYEVFKAMIGNSTLNAPGAGSYVSNQLEKLSEYEVFKAMIGNSTLNAPVPIWKKHRKILIPAFTSKMLDKYFPKFIAKSKVLVEKLNEKADEGELELWPFISTYELAIVCETTYGVDVNCQENSNHPFLVQVEIAMEILSNKIFKYWQRLDWVFKCSSQYRLFSKAMKTLNDFILEIIRMKREEIRKNLEQNANGFENGVSEMPSFLELVLRLEDDAGYSDTELMEELLALTLAGTDTSALSLCFMLELLGKYPDVQEKLYEEVMEVVGDSDRPLEKTDLPQLQYMERFIKESLRLFSPSSVIGRKVEEEITLPSGATLPAGTGFIISVFGVHRSPVYWGPDAEEFNPDRWLPDRLKLPHPCCYLPFSNGPRNCPGYQFGNMTLKIALSDLVRKFRIVTQPEKTAVPNIEAKFDILAKPLYGVRATLKRRH